MSVVFVASMVLIYYACCSCVCRYDVYEYSYCSIMYILYLCYACVLFLVYDCRVGCACILDVLTWLYASAEYISYVLPLIHAPTTNISLIDVLLLLCCCDMILANYITYYCIYGCLYYFCN